MTGDSIENRIPWAVVATLLLGVFMGALDSSLVSPARRVIEQGLGVDSTAGVWMITIYTLVYAVSMPITGKLADILGRAGVFRFSVVLFAFGALLAGLADYFGGFPLLLVGRAVQALGGGGIMPIAAAEISGLFPASQRGMALGIMGATFGVASILGPTLGSSLLDLFGTDNWGALFFVQVPFAIAPFLPAASLRKDTGAMGGKPLDLAGAGVLTASLLSFMYGLTNLKLNRLETLGQADVWPFLLVGLALVPLFVRIEKRAVDPVMNMDLFRSRDIALALIVSVFTGICLMGIIFVPQWAENLLRIPSGKGGYIVTAMALFSGVAAPMGGRFVDKWGPKWVITAGFLCTTAGTLLMAYRVEELWQVFIALALVGWGIGFTMGTPLNYLILASVSERESGSALAVLSLFRSIGTTLAPSLMAGYLAEAGKNLMPALKESIPAFSMMPTAGASGGGAMKGMDILRSADVTDIVVRMQESIKGMDGIPPMIKPMVLAQVKANGQRIEDVYQTVMGSGFHDIHVATAIFAVIGVLLTLALAGRPKECGATKIAGNR